MNEITIGDKIYISSKRAAEITGYAKDYVGQLCREGHIDAKMVGRSWYVFEPSIRAHRFGEATPPASSATSSTEYTPALAPASEALVVDAAQNTLSPARDAASAWEKPVYTAEEPDSLPKISAAVLPIVPMHEPASAETLTDMQSAWREWFEHKQNVLESGVQDVPELETPEILDARANEYERQYGVQEQAEVENEADTEEETAIPLHKIENEAVDEEEQEEVYEDSPETVYEPVRVAPDEEDAEPIAIRRVAPVASYEPVRSMTPRETDIHQGRVVEERIITRAPSKKNAKASKAVRTNTGKSRSNAPVIALLVAISLIAASIGLIGSGLADKYIRIDGTNPIINFLVGTSEYNSD